MSQIIKTPSGREFSSIVLLRTQLKVDIILACRVQDVMAEAINDDDILINGDGALQLDSMDAIEIACMVDLNYGIKIKDISSAKITLKSVATLADHILAHSKSVEK